MCAEKNCKWEKRTFACCNFDGIAEMMKDCFPDDAGYSECLAKMKEMQDKQCSPKTDASASGDEQDCCG